MLSVPKLQLGACCRAEVADRACHQSRQRCLADAVGAAKDMNVTNKLVPKGVTSNTSAASIFRIIERFQPTLLLDEADTHLKNNDELRGIINSGHHRTAAYVLRVAGDELEPKLFST